ncbi:MAG: sugar ABC transporter permease [Nitrospinae bacterium]|nr:sugar ABC transporter permease [Nitrospinota bacterium]
MFRAKLSARREAYYFASPALFLIVAFIIFPLLYSFYLTFQNYDLAIGPPSEYVGVDNYRELFSDDYRFWRSWLNTFIIIFPAITLQLLLGLGIALLLNRIPRGKALITSLLIIPSMVSPVSAAMVWRMLYGVKYGGINNFFRQVGVLDVYFDWFATPALAIFSTVMVEVWHNTSFMMIVLLAGLQSIPQELYEAGEVDGASAWQKFWYITLPLLKFTMIVALLIRMIDLTKLFSLIFLLTFGGPGGATQTVAFNTYLVGFRDFRISYASTMSYIIVVGVFFLTLIFQKVSRFREGEEA